MGHKAFKYQLQPTTNQTQMLTKWIGHSRFIWNYSLDLNKKQYETNKKFIFYADLCSRLPFLKEEKEWLKEIPAQAIQQKMKDFEKALKSVWKSGFGFPKYKNKDDLCQSFRIPQQAKQIKPNKKHIVLPKIGAVKWKKHRDLEGKLKSVTIKRENDRWWIICLCEVPDVMPVNSFSEEEIVGIDLGINKFYVSSDAVVVKPENNYRKEEKRLAKKQRNLSKKKKGSSNRNKARKKVNKLHYKIKNRRNDFLHKTSTQITNEYLIIAHEDLNVKSMTKGNIAKSICDQGWGTFISQLAYKSGNRGGRTVAIDRFKPSTKTCSCCGAKRDIPRGEETYECFECGHKLDRDLNAAFNIKRFGIEKLNTEGTSVIYACGDTTIRPNKQLFDRYVSLETGNIPLIEEEAP